MRRLGHGFAWFSLLATLLAGGRWLFTVVQDPAVRAHASLLTLSTRAVHVEADGDRLLVLYDVEDLLDSHVDVPAPEISLNLAPRGEGSPAGVVTFVDEELQGPSIDADKLVELIEGKLGEDEPGWVECHEGLLVASKSLDSHVKIARLLAALAAD